VLSCLSVITLSLQHTLTPWHQAGMQVLAILARKGGVGKSLLARALAVQALTQGKRAAILDADPQGTVLAWRARRPHPAPHVVGLGNRAMADVLREIKSGGGDIALIDTPPHAQPIISKAAELADAAIIVTGTGPEDIEQIRAVYDIVSNLRKPAGIVINKAKPNTAALKAARGGVLAFSMPVCPTDITDRVVHPYASANGLSVQETDPEGRAAIEIGEVWEWLVTRVLSSESATTPGHDNTRTRPRRTRIPA
jgi:chromosome partitioning protein